VGSGGKWPRKCQEHVAVITPDLDAGFLAPNMKDIFFHSSSVSAWAGYAVTFVLRPFGGLINGGLAENALPQSASFNQPALSAKCHGNFQTQPRAGKVGWLTGMAGTPIFATFPPWYHPCGLSSY